MAPYTNLKPEMLGLFTAELQEQLRVQTSDRATAVCALAGLDYMLESCLRDVLNRDLRDSDFSGASGVLSNLSAKIRIAYAIGFISKDEESELNLLRRIRNDFAHSIGNSTFWTPPTFDRCKSLKLCDRLYMPAFPIHPDLGSESQNDDSIPVIDMKFPGTGDPRERFVTATFVLCQVILARWMTATKPLKQPKEFNDVLDLVTMQVDALDKLFGQIAAARKVVQESVDQGGSNLRGETRDRLLETLAILSVEDDRANATYAFYKYAKKVYDAASKSDAGNGNKHRA